MATWNTQSHDVAIVSGARTPWCKMGGPMKNAHAGELAKRAFEEALYRSAYKADQIDEVILGNVVMPVDAANLARVSALWAGIPERVPAITVQRNCASGMEAIAQAGERIQGGRSKAVLAGGAESMSNIPLMYSHDASEAMMKLGKAKSAWGKAQAFAGFRPHHFLKPVVGLECGLTDPVSGLIMGKTAEVVAHEFNVTREEQDEYALHSHEKAIAAQEAGRLDDEIVPYFSGKSFTAITKDVGPRAGQTMESLSGLKPIFDRKDGSVTVGNACQVTDGAAAALVMDGEFARSENREVLGYVKGYSVVGLDPARMGLGPVYAIEQLLRETGLKLSDIPLFEINEAFAAQVIACMRAMGSDKFAQQHLNRSEALGEIDPSRLNVNGGAIALGHPVGATGTRLVLTLLNEMKRRNLNLGIAALCVGGGQGAAMLLERR